MLQVLLCCAGVKVLQVASSAAPVLHDVWCMTRLLVRARPDAERQTETDQWGVTARSGRIAKAANVSISNRGFGVRPRLPRFTKTPLAMTPFAPSTG